MKRATLLALTLLCARTAFADPTAAEILKKADDILAPAEYEADFKMTTARSDGSNRSFSMHVWKKGTTLLRVKFTAPADDKNSEVLRSGDNMWNYLPNLKRALRISPKQEFHGGDFNNTDILRVNLSEDYVPQMGTASSPDEYQLDLKAKDDSISYSLVKLWVRKKDSMPLRQEFYTSSNKLLRKLEMSEPKTYGKLVRPSKFVMLNMLTPGRQTEMSVDAFEVKSGLSDSLFEMGALGR